MLSRCSRIVLALLVTACGEPGTASDRARPEGAGVQGPERTRSDEHEEEVRASDRGEEDRLGLRGPSPQPSPAAAGEGATREGSPSPSTSTSTSGLVAVRASVAPVLDGSLDDDAWRDAPVIAITSDYAGGPVASPTTEIRLAWDAGALYIAFDASFDAPLTAPEGPAASEEAHLYAYDVVELFVDADPATPRSYREIELGPRGHFLDIAVDLDARPHGDVSWSSGLAHAERIDDDTHRFVIEARLPASALGLGALEPRALRVGLFRITGHAPAPRLFLSRFPTGTARPQFHVPERFGTLTLAP